MTDFTSEVRKPVSTKIIGKRMECVLVEYETNGNTRAYNDQLATSSSASTRAPYTTQYGLDNQPEILDFASQSTTTNSTDINRNNEKNTRPDNVRQRPRPLNRGKNNHGSTNNRSNNHSNNRSNNRQKNRRGKFLLPERTENDIENEIFLANVQKTLRDGAYQFLPSENQKR